MASSTIYLLSSYHLIVMLFAVLEDFKKKVTDSHDLSIAEREVWSTFLILSYITLQ